MYRTDIRPPAATAAFSTTSTTLATLTIPAVANRRINVVGYSIAYAAAPGTATAPTISTSAGILYVIGTAVTANQASIFPFPVVAQTNMAVKLQATLTAAGVINLSLLYFYDV